MREWHSLIHYLRMLGHVGVRRRSILRLVVSRPIRHLVRGDIALHLLLLQLVLSASIRLHIVLYCLVLLELERDSHLSLVSLNLL